MFLQENEVKLFFFVEQQNLVKVQIFCAPLLDSNVLTAYIGLVHLFLYSMGLQCRRSIIVLKSLMLLDKILIYMVYTSVGSKCQMGRCRWS